MAPGGDRSIDHLRYSGALATTPNVLRDSFMQICSKIYCIDICTLKEVSRVCLGL